MQRREFLLGIAASAVAGPGGCQNMVRCTLTGPFVKDYLTADELAGWPGPIPWASHEEAIAWIRNELVRVSQAETEAAATYFRQLVEATGTPERYLFGAADEFVVSEDEAMSVLQFNMPTRESLRCDHPVCYELANARIELAGYEPGATLKEIFACTTHCAQLQIGKPIAAVEKLRQPGERNAPKVEQTK